MLLSVVVPIRSLPLILPNSTRYSQFVPVGPPPAAVGGGGGGGGGGGLFSGCCVADGGDDGAAPPPPPPGAGRGSESVEEVAVRFLTPRECARLMGFPDAFVLARPACAVEAAAAAAAAGGKQPARRQRVREDRRCFSMPCRSPAAPDSGTKGGQHSITDSLSMVAPASDSVHGIYSAFGAFGMAPLRNPAPFRSNWIPKEQARRYFDRVGRLFGTAHHFFDPMACLQVRASKRAALGVEEDKAEDKPLEEVSVRAAFGAPNRIAQGAGHCRRRPTLADVGERTPLERRKYRLHTNKMAPIISGARVGVPCGDLSLYLKTTLYTIWF